MEKLIKTVGHWQQRIHEAVDGKALSLRRSTVNSSVSNKLNVRNDS